MRRDLRDIDLAHFALEAVDHERFKVRTKVAVGRKDAPNLILVDADRVTKASSSWLSTV